MANDVKYRKLYEMDTSVEDHISSFTILHKEREDQQNEEMIFSNNFSISSKPLSESEWFGCFTVSIEITESVLECLMLCPCGLCLDPY